MIDYLRTAPIPPTRWGKDHLSLIVFLETICVDKRGVLQQGDMCKMSCHRDRHYRFAHIHYTGFGGAPGTPSTRLRDGEIDGYDDWDCLADLVDFGFATATERCVEVPYTIATFKNGKQRKHPLKRTRTVMAVDVRLTDAGFALAHAIRKHLATNDVRSYASFVVPSDVLQTQQVTQAA